MRRYPHRVVAGRLTDKRESTRVRVEKVSCEERRGAASDEGVVNHFVEKVRRWGCGRQPSWKPIFLWRKVGRGKGDHGDCEVGRMNELGAVLCAVTRLMQGWKRR